MKFYGTQETAAALKIKPDRLQKKIWQGDIPAPQKGPGGNYLWTLEDIERTAWALKRYPEFVAWGGGQND